MAEIGHNRPKFRIFYAKKYTVVAVVTNMTYAEVKNILFPPDTLSNGIYRDD